MLSADVFNCGSICVTKNSEVNVVFLGNMSIRTIPHLEKVVNNITFSSPILCFVFVGLVPPYVYNPSAPYQRKNQDSSAVTTFLA